MRQSSSIDEAKYEYPTVLITRPLWTSARASDPLVDVMVHAASAAASMHSCRLALVALSGVVNVARILLVEAMGYDCGVGSARSARHQYGVSKPFSTDVKRPRGYAHCGARF